MALLNSHLILYRLQIKFKINRKEQLSFALAPVIPVSHLLMRTLDDILEVPDKGNCSIAQWYRLASTLKLSTKLSQKVLIGFNEYSKGQSTIHKALAEDKSILRKHLLNLLIGN